MARNYERVENNIWKPQEEGDALEGVVTAVNIAGVFGFQATVKRDSDGKMLLTPNQKVLQNLLQNSGVKVGDAVRIRFTHSEKPKVKGQSPTMMYELDISRA